MEIINNELDKYLHHIIPERDVILAAMEDFGEEKDFPLVGPLVGRLLHQLATLNKAKRVLELGSGYGYSAMWFANAVGDKGKVICTDGTAGNKDVAELFFKKAKLWNRIDFRIGNGLEIIDELDGEFDIIFNDIDKADYPEAFHKDFPRLRKGGLLITDNVLWSGKVLDKKPDKATAGVLTYNRLVYSSHQLYTTIIPLRDGVAVSVKI